MSDSDTVGINLETLDCYCTGNSSHGLGDVPTLKIPPAMVVPSSNHELKLDRWFPPDPAGTGETWPAAAEVSGGFSRRMPIGLLWEHGWTERVWKVDAENSIDPIEAIGYGAREVVSGNINFAGLVIPNWLRQAQQQSLLDSLSGSGVKWFLVWRPIAAATEWLDRFPLTPPKTRKRKCIGKLVVLHLGLFESEFTVIELVAEPFNGGVTLLPARLRADKKNDFKDGTISDLILYQSAVHQGVSPEDASLWKQLWATPWLSRQFDGWNHRPQLPKALCPDHFDPLPFRLGSIDTPSTMRNSGIEWNTQSLESLERWIINKLKQCDPIEGAIVTGELSKLWFNTDAANALKHVVAPERILVGDCRDNVNILSSGAAKQCAKLAKSEPAYLTKLPLLKTVISRAGEPEWISLLDEDDAYVLGGKKWARPEPVGGIRIPGANVLKLAIDHEDFDSVREAEITIPDSVPANHEAELLVEITPAQGNAKVEVATVPRVKTRTPLIANLQKMEEVVDQNEAPLSPRKYLDWYPRIAPPLLPRLSSPIAWSNLAEAYIAPLLHKSPHRWESYRMEKLREELRKKRNPGSLRNITAIGSDGEVSTYRKELKALISGAAELLSSSDRDRQKEATRILAYVSADDVAVRKHIRSWGRTGPETDEQFRLVGNCLRSPKGIRDFLLNSQDPSTQQIRTIAELICYRSNALEFIDSDYLETLYEVITQRFEDLSYDGNYKYHFRHATLCLAFLLRRRIYDDSFISPTDEIASRVKRVCQEVIEASKSGDVYIMGGSVNLPAIMRQLIEYIDREGHGAFVLAM